MLLFVPKMGETTANKQKNSAEQRDYNQRWFGYFGLLVFSLANFASVVDAKTFQGAGERAFSIAVGALSTTVCALVLLFDRVNKLAELFDIVGSKVWDVTVSLLGRKRLVVLIVTHGGKLISDALVVKLLLGVLRCEPIDLLLEDLELLVGLV